MSDRLEISRHGQVQMDIKSFSGTFSVELQAAIMRPLIVLFVVFSVIVQQGYALRCHYCNSLEDPNCSDSLNRTPTTLQECSAALMQQTVNNIETIVLGNEPQQTRLKGSPKYACVTGIYSSGELGRGCTVPNHPVYDLCKKYGELLVSCKTCTGEGCNYRPQPRPQLPPQTQPQFRPQLRPQFHPQLSHLLQL